MPFQRYPMLSAYLLLLCFVRPITLRAEEDEVAKALSALDAKEYQARIEAASSLGSAKPTKPVLSALVRRLADPDWGVQIAVCDALGRLGDPDPTVALAEKTIEGEVFFVRAAAQRAVLDLDRSKAIGYFLKVAKTGKGEPRLRAIRALAAMRDERLAAEFALLNAKEKDPWVRGEALHALGAIAKGKQGGPLLDGLGAKGFAAQYGALLGAAEFSARDEKERKRVVAQIAAFLAAERPGYVLRRARAALGPIDSAAFTEALRAEMAKANPDAKAYLARIAAALNLRDLAPDVRELTRSKDEKVRAGGAAALGALADDAAATLRDLVRDPSPLVQSAAYVALHRTLGERVDPARLADYPPDLRLLALGDLGREKIGKDEELAPLSKLLADSDWRVACAAAVTLGKLFQERALPALTPLLRHADWRIRGAVAAALPRMRRKESVPPLLDLLQDKHPIVQGAALKGLQHLTSQTFPLDAGAWRNWWAAHQEKFSPFNPQDIIKGLRASGYGTDEYIYKLFQNMEIVVVSGSWDHVEQVLDDLKLKHQLVAPSELAKAYLNPRQILLLNCGSQVGGKNADILEWFVVTGGYVMSTDWTIQDTLERLFPAWLTSYKKEATNDDVVVSEPCSDDPLLKNVFADHARTKIWLEIQSFGIQINNPYLVDTLVDSLELNQKYHLEPLCVAFDLGHGRIFHSMSHFYLQKQSLASVRTKQELKIFAIDHLGLNVDQVRVLDEKGDFDAAGKEPLSRHYPVFKVIVNYVNERLERELGED